jgi:mRNA deadenylase 3'-5' endonuclease subunit Ccr4
LKEELEMSGEFRSKQESIDGLATYFNHNLFKLLKTFYVPYNFNAYSELYCKDKGCLIVVLESIKYPSKLFIVSNTHINFNSNRGDIKLAEVKLMTDALSQLKSFYTTYRTDKKYDISIISSGDFNSAPRGGIYEFMR